MKNILIEFLVDQFQLLHIAQITFILLFHLISNKYFIPFQTPLVWLSSCATQLRVSYIILKKSVQIVLHVRRYFKITFLRVKSKIWPMTVKNSQVWIQDFCDRASEAKLGLEIGGLESRDLDPRMYLLRTYLWDLFWEKKPIHKANSLLTNHMMCRQ